MQLAIGNKRTCSLIVNAFFKMSIHNKKEHGSLYKQQRPLQELTKHTRSAQNETSFFIDPEI